MRSYVVAVSTDVTNAQDLCKLLAAQLVKHGALGPIFAAEVDTTAMVEVRDAIYQAAVQEAGG